MLATIHLIFMAMGPSLIYFLQKFQPSQWKRFSNISWRFFLTDLIHVLEYNVREGTLVRRNNFPISFRNGQSFVVRVSQLFVTGGYSDADSSMVWQYHQKNDSWRDVTQLLDSKKNGISLVYNTD